MKRIGLFVVALLLTQQTFAQTTKSDTVVVELAKTSKLIFTMRDRNDLVQLRQIDFQALFNDLLNRLEKNDTLPKKDTTKTEIIVERVEEEEPWENDPAGDYSWEKKNKHRYYGRGSRHSFNFDLGTNNYLSDGEFPEANEPYAVRPWGSWYVAINSVQRSRLANKFFLEWGVGISWYNFKFEDSRTFITKTDDGLDFEIDQRDASFRKSKLTASYINVSLIPMLDFGGYNRKARLWDSHGSNFRIGIGPYAGYRIGSHTKVKYKEDGDMEKDKDRDNFYLNNFRYGVRLQLGIRSTDFFFNYDLNELFTNKETNPKLNAISFGVIF